MTIERLGVSVTAFNEDRRGGYAWIRECLAAPLASPLVEEVLVYDDASEHDSLAGAIGDHEKLRIDRGSQNLGVLGAKLESVARSSAEWVLMADSDNVFARDALERIRTLELRADTLYAPSFGHPVLDYRHLRGRWGLADVPRLLLEPVAGCAVNTGNQLVHRATFTSAFSRYRGPRFDLLLPDYLGVGDRADLRWRRIYDSADSFFINRTWWLSGGAVEFVDGLEYVHGSLTPEHRAVARSSWDQAPPEKERMPGFFAEELLAAARRIA